MFDKRLTKLCPESKKYIAGNIILQWLELALNTVMVITAVTSLSVKKSVRLGMPAKGS